MVNYSRYIPYMEIVPAPGSAGVILAKGTPALL